MELAIKLLIPISFFIIVCGIPFVYVLFCGKILKGMFLVWGLSVLYFVIVTIPIFDLVWYYDKEMTKGMPEGNSIVASILTGWLPGLIISGIAALTRRGIIYFWPTAFVGISKKK